MAKTAAILYKKDGYNTNSQRLLGRQSASEGFLKALVRHSKAECLYCYTDTKAEYTEFCEQIRPLIQGSQNVR
ncbi:MAG TPA: glycosyl transferase, partial [Cyanobacteria bacterium UBA12227]|nr:glycosyl transferase [Cyanobacteria bacterium UBA12227]